MSLKAQEDMSIILFGSEVCERVTLSSLSNECPTIYGQLAKLVQKANEHPESSRSGTPAFAAALQVLVCVNKSDGFT